MNTNFEVLYDNKFPTALDSLFEIIDNLNEKFIDMGVKTRWTKLKYFTEYGFYIDSSDEQKNLFVGLWYELWETKCYPFCLCLDWKNTRNNSLRYTFKEVLANYNDSKIKFIDYNDYPNLVFQAEYFKGLIDNKELFNLIVKSLEALSFNLYFKK